MSKAARRAGTLLLAVVATAAVSGSLFAQERVNSDAKAVAELQKRITAYVGMQRKLAKTLPALPSDATPEQIDARKRALARLVQQARKGAKVGDVFYRDVRPVLRRILTGLFKGPDGKKLRAAIYEENPGEAVKLVVNGRYPDTVPLSTVPPQVLQALPSLPEELEYRFIEDRLILFDTPAHIIVDYLAGAVPR